MNSTVRWSCASLAIIAMIHMCVTVTNIDDSVAQRSIHVWKLDQAVEAPLGRQCIEDVTIDLPEYDLRRAYTAQDPLAVIEAYKIEILLRLGMLLGIRICPQCLRCNNGSFGCQDKFGSNMRPGGGVVGGVVALGGATEHQGYGTPHLHVEIHIACAYQYGTLHEVADLLKKNRFSFDQWIAYQEWFHAEDVIDPEVKQTLAKDLEEQWHSRFAGKDRKVLNNPLIFHFQRFS